MVFAHTSDRCSILIPICYGQSIGQPMFYCLLSDVWSVVTLLEYIVFCHSYWLWSVVFVFWRMVSRKILIWSFTSPMNIFFQVTWDYCKISATSKYQKSYLYGHTPRIPVYYSLLPFWRMFQCFFLYFATHTTFFFAIFGVIILFFPLFLYLYIINICLHKRYISIYQDFSVSISLSLWLFKSLVEIIETTRQYRNLPSQHKTKFIATFFFSVYICSLFEPLAKNLYVFVCNNICGVTLVL